MFTKISSCISIVSEGTAYWTLGTLQSVKMYFQKFAKENSQKISRIMMASKMLSVFILLALIPLDATKVQKQPQQIEVKFDQSNPTAVVGKERQIAIATGEANIDLQTKGSAQKVAYADYVGQSIERDPSYFRGLYERAGSAYGIPWQLLEAVHYVETGASDSTFETSYAGATGPMQFMPGTWRTYGVDGNGDGQAQITNVEDAVYGAANLLATGGAASGDYQSALFNYNHAQWYVNKVLNIARDAGMSV